MPLVAQVQGLVWLLSKIVPNLSDLTCHLYQNDVDITPETELEDFVECDFPGYAPVAFSAWTPAAATADLSAATAHTAIVWTRGGSGLSNQVFGYYVVYSPANLLVWAEADPDGPAYLSVPGQTFIVIPQLNLSNLLLE